MKRALLISIAFLSSAALAQNVFKLYTAPTFKVEAGGIEIAYKIFGTGDPILLVAGYGAPLESWDPFMIEDLAKNYTVIVFDNRGVGSSTTSAATPSIPLFASDAANLVKALQLKKVNIMGWSMGGYIAQEFALNYPEMTEKLILLSTDCGGENSIPPSSRAISLLQSMNDPKIFIEVLFPDDWAKLHPEVTSRFTDQKSFDGNDSNSGIIDQYEAVGSWEGTYDRLKQLKPDTLIITGTDDIIVSEKNSLIMASQITGSWLIRLKDGGHGAIYQFPGKIAAILNAFLK